MLKIFISKTNSFNAWPLAALSVLFFSWGFITSLNDILIPHLKALFTLSYTQAMGVQFAFFTAYFLLSAPSAWLLRKIRFQGGMVLGLAVAGVGCALFYPAAAWREYGVFLAALFVLAAGVCLLQVAANPYAAALGAPDSASRRLTLVQAFNSLGATVGPYIGAGLILERANVAADAATQAWAVQAPYLGLALILCCLAAVFWRLPLPRAAADAPCVGSSAAASVWAFPHLSLGAVAIFVYVGAEVAIGSFLVSFLGEPSVAGLPAAAAGRYVAVYWGGAMLGRFAGVLLMRRISGEAALAGHALAAALLLCASLLGEGVYAMWALLAVGLCNSIMFPTIFALAVSGLGEQTGKGSGILCAAIIGGALLPLLQGAAADAYGLRNAFVLPVFCYVYILLYAMSYRRLRGSSRFNES